MTGTAPIHPSLSGRTEILRDRTAVKVNRIRYPYPNTLGLVAPARV